MKKLLYLGLCAILALFTSCTKDGGSLVGTWEGVDAVMKMTYEGMSQSQTLEFEPGAMVWVFKADGTAQVQMLDEASEIGTYVKNGSKLTITIDDESEDFTIKELSASKLAIGMVQTEDGVKMDVTFNFRKI